MEYKIGETIWFNGQKWEIADRHNGEYALWKQREKNDKRSKVIVNWIPERYIASIYEGEIKYA